MNSGEGCAENRALCSKFDSTTLFSTVPHGAQKFVVVVVVRHRQPAYICRGRQRKRESDAQNIHVPFINFAHCSIELKLCLFIFSILFGVLI